MYCFQFSKSTYRQNIFESNFELMTQLIEIESGVGGRTRGKYREANFPSHIDEGQDPAHYKWTDKEKLRSSNSKDDDGNSFLYFALVNNHPKQQKE